MGAVHVLLFFQAAACAADIIVGGIVEGFGYGLSMGTSWPYRRDILRLARSGDPEAWHRIVATILGINAVVLAVTLRDVNAMSGLALIGATALLGIATLNVLAGKAPAFLHGLHGLLAYSTLLAYLAELMARPRTMWTLLSSTVSLHAFLLVVFLGGMVSGRRGGAAPIGTFVLPRTGIQWAFAIHGAAWAALILALAGSGRGAAAALVCALIQAGLGFVLYQSVNARPRRPGILLAFHQGMGLLIIVSIVSARAGRVPFLG